MTSKASETINPRRSRVLGSFLASSLALLVVGACANLTPIAEGSCGNSVREAGEDCDGESNCYAAGTTFACRYQCETDEDCPEGDCSVDGVCRRPSGSFAIKQIVPSTGTLSLATGDLDADGRDDIIREGAELTDILFIGEDGLIETTETIERLREINPPVIADLTQTMGAEEGERLDVAFSINLGDETGSGLSVYRTQADRTLEATAYPTLPIPGEAIRGIAARVIGDDERQEILGFVTGGMAPSFTGVGEEQSLTALALDREPHVRAFAGLAVGELIDNDCDEVVYGEIANGSVPGDKVWIVVPCETSQTGAVGWRVGGPANAEVTTLQLPAGVTLVYPDAPFFGSPETANTGLIRSGIFVADFEGDGDDDVYALAKATDGKVRLFVARNDDPGFGPFIPLPCGDTCSDLGQPLAIADLGGTGAADYVFERGILFALNPSGGTAFQTFDPLEGTRWLAAEIADLDRDGFVDVAVSRLDEDGDGPAQGIEILRNHEGKGLFTRELVPTQRPVAHISTGDYDGDGAADLAYVEYDFTVPLPEMLGPGSGLPLHVAFGQASGGLTATRKLGELPVVEQIISGRVFGGDGAAELLALAQPQNQTALAIFGGTASRQLVAPFFFSYRDGAQVVPGRIDGAVAGTFEPGAGTQLAILTNSIFRDLSTFGPETVLWRADVGAEAELSVFPKLGEGEQPLEADCFECLLVPLDPDADGVDDLYAFEDLTLAYDSSAGMRIRRFVPSGNGFDQAEVVAEIAGMIVPVFEELVTVNPPLIRDVDGDGDDDLVLIGASVEETSDGSYLLFDQVVMIFDNDEGTFGSYRVVHPPTEGADVTAVALAQIDRDPELELIVSEIVGSDTLVETGKVWILDYDPDSGDYGASDDRRRPLVAGPEVPSLVRALTSGDYDGDGVDDVIVGGDESYLVVKGVPAEP